MTNGMGSRVGHVRAPSQPAPDYDTHSFANMPPPSPPPVPPLPPLRSPPSNNALRSPASSAPARRVLLGGRLRAWKGRRLARCGRAVCVLHTLDTGRGVTAESIVAVTVVDIVAVAAPTVAARATP